MLISNHLLTFVYTQCGFNRTGIKFSVLENIGVYRYLLFQSFIPDSTFKVEKILKGSLDSIPSPSRSCEHLNFLFSFFGHTIAGHCHQTLLNKSLLSKPSNVLPLQLKPTFPLIISIFTVGDGIESKPGYKFR